jgi:hypothetical protein
MTIYTKDSFVDTTGTNLEAHTPSGTGATGSWNRIGGAAGQAKINANALEFAGTTQTLYAATDNGTADHYAQAVMGLGFNTGSGYFPLVIRAVDENNFIGYRYFNLTSHDLYTCVGGSFTSLASVAGSLNATDTIYLEASGNSITVKRNGTTIIGPITSSALNTATKSGLVTRSANATDVLRSWESGSLATITYTYARPTSDITTQWSTSTGTDHYALIDETTANDADYIYATAAGQTDEVRLASMTAPQAGTDLLINYKVAGIVGSASVTMSLRQGSGGTLIATDTAKTSDNTYQLIVPAATWSSTVTDWTDLRLRFVSA